ncbi:glyoxalase family protein [Enterococcus hermanniensis]|uniref:Glyoxalase family protein n=1 Tax=Enterococcus hermanniensis TaxID=249189 RepID=A0A1L8TPC5_9ENTE|nr:glyoxalase family protein [Enterococcus hermanniensis]
MANIEKLAAFYSEIIGLTILEKSERTVSLGVARHVLLELQKVDNPLPLTRKTGLFHVAFLVPTRKDLGNMLYHYLEAQAPLQGASDHGYSEALYLTDPEGNGIEVYHDKSRSEWDIRPNGDIIGITIEMDAARVLAVADRKSSAFPEGTTVGHVHLKVSDLAKTDDFYTNILGLTRTSDFGSQAKFFAAGDYHHHIGSNIWLGNNIPAMEENDLGLDYYTFVVPNQATFDQLKEHLKATNTRFEVETHQSLSLSDPSGILIRVEVK